MHPQSMSIIGNELVIVWDDGHEAYYSAEMLRRACPCAYCAGEADLFGRVAKPAYRPLSPASFELLSATPVGNYGVQVEFADRHGYGIWTFPNLREACECDACRSTRSPRELK